MPLDDLAKKFLAGGQPVQVVPTQEATKAAGRIAEYRTQEFLERSGGFYEELLGFFLQQKKKHNYLDEECVGAIALFTINLREAYGRPQNSREKETWSDEKRDMRLAEFDRICEEMQNYYDETEEE